MKLLNFHGSAAFRYGTQTDDIPIPWWQRSPKRTKLSLKKSASQTRDLDLGKYAICLQFIV